MPPLFIFFLRECATIICPSTAGMTREIVEVKLKKKIFFEPKPFANEDNDESPEVTNAMWVSNVLEF